MWVNCVCFKNIMPYHTIVFFLSFSPCFPCHNFSGISRNQKRKIILQIIGKLIQFSYLLLQKEIFLVYSFSEQITAKGNSSEPPVYLHIIIIDIMQQGRRTFGCSLTHDDHQTLVVIGILDHLQDLNCWFVFCIFSAVEITIYAGYIGFLGY